MKNILFINDRRGFATVILALLVSVSSFSQTLSLPRSIPEKEGVSSKGIHAFLDAVATGKHGLHSLMMLRHGKVVAEGWWDPYDASIRHTMYSASKSFTATAIGFAVAENKLRVTDKVISFFPTILPDSVSPNLASMTIKHLLTMSAGQDPDPSFPIAGRDTNWAKSFLATPIRFEPGSVFLYNSMATYMLSAILQKVTGERLVDFLQPRLFEPLGITGMDWESDLLGINTGGWGLRIKTEDMAKFGQLFLQKGKWNGRQLLPAAWVVDASSAQIIQHPDFTQEQRDQSDWEQGYGYQMWRSRHQSYRGDGAYGQYILVLPEKDAVIIITSEVADMQAVLNLVWQHLLPAMHPGKLKKSKESKSLRRRLDQLALPTYSATGQAGESFALPAMKYRMEQNDQQVKTVSFTQGNDNLVLNLQLENKDYPISFGKNTWISGTTSKPGPSLVLQAKGHLESLPVEKVTGRYYYPDPNTLVLELRYIESAHGEIIVCRFENDQLIMDWNNSIDFGKKKTTWKGTAVSN